MSAVPRERRREDRRKDHELADQWHSESLSGLVLERRRGIRRGGDGEQPKHSAWNGQGKESCPWIRQIVLDQVTILLREEGDSQVVQISGDLCHADFGEVREILERVCHSGSTHVVLDLASLRRVDSAGIGVLVGLRLLQAPKNAHVRLTGVTRPVGRLLEKCRVRKLFCIEPLAG